MPIRCVLAVITVLAACEHGAPFHPADYGPKGPLVADSIARLTYNPGQDLVPAWLPDGGTIVYTAERQDRSDRDRCLAFLPAVGGVISRYACRTTAADDSLNVFDEAAIRGDSIVYVRARTQIFLSPIGPQGQDLVVAPLADPLTARVLYSLPTTTPWGTTYEGLSHVAWLGPQRVAGVGERVTYPRPCPICARDTVRTGLEILIIDFAGTTPVATRLAAGDSASSLAASASGDTLYFTRDGDSRVYRHVFASGLTDTLYDYAFGIARDVSVANGKLVAVVGGAVSYTVDSILGGSQPDDGGPLFLLTLGSADPPRQLGNPAWLFRRPALAPDGTRLVATAWTGALTADIWLFQLR